MPSSTFDNMNHRLIHIAHETRMYCLDKLFFDLLTKGLKGFISICLETKFFGVNRGWKKVIGFRQVPPAKVYQFSGIIYIYIYIWRVQMQKPLISLKWQLIGNPHCNLSEITELKHTSLIKMIILAENFKWHLEAFASELFIYIYIYIYIFCFVSWVLVC